MYYRDKWDDLADGLMCLTAFLWGALVMAIILT